MCSQHLYSTARNNFLEHVFIRSSLKYQHPILLHDFNTSDGITSLKWVARISLIDSLQVFLYCLDTAGSEIGYWLSFNGVEMEKALDLAYTCCSVYKWSHIVVDVCFNFNKAPFKCFVCIQMFCLHLNFLSCIKTTVSEPPLNFGQKCLCFVTAEIM